MRFLTTTWIQRIAGPFNTSRQRWNWKVLTHKIFKHSECLEGFCGDASMYFVNRHQIQKNISNGTKYFCKSNCQLQILNFCGSFASALVQTLKNWHYHFNSPSFQAFYSLFGGRVALKRIKINWWSLNWIRLWNWRQFIKTKLEKKNQLRLACLGVRRAAETQMVIQRFLDKWTWHTLGWLDSFFTSLVCVSRQDAIFAPQVCFGGTSLISKLVTTKPTILYHYRW